MKTAKLIRTLALCALMLGTALPGKAQLFPKTYMNVDWQGGMPVEFPDFTRGDWKTTAPLAVVS